MVPFLLHGQEIDILLKGGQVVDAKNNINAKMDVAISNGKIFRIARDIPVTNAKKVLEWIIQC